MILCVCPFGYFSFQVYLHAPLFFTYMREGSTFHFFLYEYTINPAPLIEKTILSHCTLPLSFSLIKELYMCEFISGISVMSTVIERVLSSYQTSLLCSFFHLFQVHLSILAQVAYCLNYV